MTTKLLYRGPSLSELHDRYAKQHRVDTEAPLQDRSTIEIAAPVAQVWQIVADVQSWSQWAPGITVAHVSGVRPDATFRWNLNGVEIRAAFAVVDPPIELAWTGRFLIYRAIDRVLLAALEAQRTSVTFEESLAGPLLSILYRSAQLRANHERFLTSLKKVAERAGARA